MERLEKLQKAKEVTESLRKTAKRAKEAGLGVEAEMIYGISNLITVNAFNPEKYVLARLYELMSEFDEDIEELIKNHDKRLDSN